MSERPRYSHRDDGDSAVHDVLAAEEFAMPVADPTIRPHPVVLPGDPTGIPEPHDVLAAEEFAMPAVRIRGDGPRRRSALQSRSRLIPAAVLLLALVLRRRRRA